MSERDRLAAAAAVAVLLASATLMPVFDSRDDDFSDEVHPKPRVTNQWAERLATTVTSSSSVSGTQAASAN